MKKTAILLITLTLIIAGCGKKTNNYNIDNQNGVSHAEMDNELENSTKIEEEKIGATLKASKVHSYRDNLQGQLYNEYLYYIDAENHISKINEDTGKVDKVLRTKEKVQDLTINNDRIFYSINEASENRLYFIDVNGGGIKRAVENIEGQFPEDESLLEHILINNDEIYYIRDNEIRMASISKGVTKSFFQDSKLRVKELIDIKNDEIYFTATLQGKTLVYTIDTNGENLRIITNFKEETKSLSEVFEIHGDYVYYINTDSVSRLTRIDARGNKETIFTGFDIKKFTVKDDLIYILDGSEDAVNNLFVSYINGKTKLIDDKVISYDALEEQIFYTKINDESQWIINRNTIDKDTKTNSNIHRKEQLLSFEQNENIMEMKATVGYVYYLLNDGILCRYNISTGNVKEIANNVSQLQRIKGAICYGDSLIDTLYLNNINVETTKNNDEIALMQLINDFDNAWADYVNEENENVVNYIVPKSPVTWYLAKFDRDNISEDFLDISVIDVRIDGSNAEVDVDEKIRKVTNGEVKIIDYQWTYIIKKVNGEWKIYNYRAR